jgi:lantibiotic biosynthesis protein
MTPSDASSRAKGRTDRQRTLQGDGGNCTPAAFFVFRTPLLPFHELLRFGFEPASSSVAPIDQFEQAFSAQLARERTSLKILLDRPEIREAIFVANHEFARFADSWKRDPESKKGKRAELTIVRYLARMAGRATPFGLFAGISHGTTGVKTCLNVQCREKYERCTSPSFECATRVAEEWYRDAEFIKHLPYRPNSTLYRVCGDLRYVETSRDGGEQSYRLVGVRDTRRLRRTLARAQGGATSKQLVVDLVGDGIRRKAACEFVEKLIEYQILRPELEVPVTGQPTIRYLASHLPKSAKFAKARSALRGVASGLAAIDRGGFAGAQTRYQKVLATLISLTKQPVPTRPFHATLIKPAPEASLGQDANIGLPFRFNPCSVGKFQAASRRSPH